MYKAFQKSALEVLVKWPLDCLDWEQLGERGTSAEEAGCGVPPGLMGPAEWRTCYWSGQVPLVWQQDIVRRRAGTMGKELKVEGRKRVWCSKKSDQLSWSSYCFRKQSPAGKNSQQRSWYIFHTYDSYKTDRREAMRVELWTMKVLHWPTLTVTSENCIV